MEVIKTFIKTKKKKKEKKKWGKHIQDGEHLAEELQKYLCLYEKGNKRYKETEQTENVWRAVKQFLIVFLKTISDQATL